LPLVVADDVEGRSERLCVDGELGDGDHRDDAARAHAGAQIHQLRLSIRADPHRGQALVAQQELVERMAGAGHAGHDRRPAAAAGTAAQGAHDLAELDERIVDTLGEQNLRRAIDGEARRHAAQIESTRRRHRHPRRQLGRQLQQVAAGAVHRTAQIQGRRATALPEIVDAAAERPEGAARPETELQSPPQELESARVHFRPLLERCREVQDDTGWTDPDRILDAVLERRTE